MSSLESPQSGLVHESCCSLDSVVNSLDDNDKKLFNRCYGVLQVSKPAVYRSKRVVILRSVLQAALTGEGVSLGAKNAESGESPALPKCITSSILKKSRGGKSKKKRHDSDSSSDDDSSSSESSDSESHSRKKRKRKLKDLHIKTDQLFGTCM